MSDPAIIGAAKDAADRLQVPWTEEGKQHNRKVIQSAIETTLSDAHMKRFPMLDGPSIPWRLAEIIYSGYSAIYGVQQSLQRICERGGFGWSEIPLWWKNERFRAAVFAAMSASAGQDISEMKGNPRLTINH